MVCESITGYIPKLNIYDASRLSLQDNVLELLIPYFTLGQLFMDIYCNSVQLEGNNTNKKRSLWNKDPQCQNDGDTKETMEKFSTKKSVNTQTRRWECVCNEIKLVQQGGSVESAVFHSTQERITLRYIQ